MIWNGELHQSVVCSGFLLVNLVCNTFLVSVCVRSSVLQSGVRRFVLLSPRVILVGTVLRAAASCVKSLYRLCVFCEYLRRGSRSLGCRIPSATALTSGFGALPRYTKHGRRVVPRSTEGRARRLTSNQQTNDFQRRSTILLGFKLLLAEADFEDVQALFGILSGNQGLVVQ